MEVQMRTPGQLLQMHGPVVSRVLQRQFPSLSADIIDNLVVEAIARVSKQIDSGKPIAEKMVFPLILITAKRRAIDHLRYSPRLVFALPDLLEQAPAATPAEKEEPLGGMVSDLRAAMAALEPLDRRILRAATTSMPNEPWTRTLALELLRENSSKNRNHDEATIDARELSKLRGKLRVRKMRAVEKLRRLMRRKGYDLPE
jgi:DNA-directed RNA polymerase specialized sigma24 family protein